MAIFSKARLKKTKHEEPVIKKHTILIVDDEVPNLLLLSDLLEKEYHILMAHDGQEALDLVKNDENRERIHLIISDQRMPRMTGTEFLEQTISLIPKTKRIILTGFTDIEAIIDSINKGKVYKFMVKPFDPQDMLITVRIALDLYDLEAENILLTTTNRKLTDLNQTKEQLLKKLNNLYNNEVKALEKIHLEGIEGNSEKDKEAIRQSIRIGHQIEQTLRPITSLYTTEQAIKDKRVLLAESNNKQKLIAKMALGGTGVCLDIASSVEEGNRLLEENPYDIICTNAELIELVSVAQQKNPNIFSVFMTSENVSSYFSLLQQYPALSNIVSRNEEDRTFTLKNISTTISKLINHDLFGLEKYLNWGVEVFQHPIVDSSTRSGLVEQMEAYFQKLGVRRSILNKCALVAEELLMNAIYDAPTDAEGKPLYNHLPRTESVYLKPGEQGKFRYACDGLLLGISVEDPFGAFDRQTILDYLESCYSGQAGTLQQNKGGAGRGLFQIMQISDLVIWNVKAKVKTEVIVLFNLDKPKNDNTTSFHYFYG